MQNYKTALGTEQTPAPTVQPIYITSGGSAIVVIAMLLFSIIILYTTNRNESSAPYGVIGSVAFFMIGTPVGLLAVNGGIAQMFGDYQREKTIRARDQQHAERERGMMAELVRPHQIERRPDAEGVQEDALPVSTSYVPAIPNERSVAKEAFLWAWTLYDEVDGEPNPDRVNMKGGTEAKGRLKIAAPTNPEVKQFLLDRKVLLRVRQEVALNVESYGNSDSLRWLMRQATPLSQDDLT